MTLTPQHLSQETISEVKFWRVTWRNTPSLPLHGAGIIPLVNRHTRAVEGAGGRPSAAAFLIRKALGAPPES